MMSSMCFYPFIHSSIIHPQSWCFYWNRSNWRSASWTVEEPGEPHTDTRRTWGLNPESNPQPELEVSWCYQWTCVFDPTWGNICPSRLYSQSEYFRHWRYVIPPAATRAETEEKLYGTAGWYQLNLSGCGSDMDWAVPLSLSVRQASS